MERQYDILIKYLTIFQIKIPINKRIFNIMLKIN